MKSWGFRITYNAPFTLTFSLICVAVFIASNLTDGWLNREICSIRGGASWNEGMTYANIFAHVFGHAHVQHLSFNLALILLLGPILEEKYGPRRLLAVATITAMVTGVIMVLVFNGHLLGASGIAFAMIILASFGSSKAGTIPLTFLCVLAIYLGHEFYDAVFKDDNVAQFAHIIGGIAGSVLGFMWNE